MPANRPPVYLDVSHIHLPLPGWVSIIQRLSGVLLFLLLPVMIYLFHLSLTRTGYAQLSQWRHMFAVKILLVGVFWLYLQHFLAGIRFLLLDIGLGAGLPWARRLSAGSLIASATLTLIGAGEWW